MEQPAVITIRALIGRNFARNLNYPASQLGKNAKFYRDRRADFQALNALFHRGITLCVCTFASPRSVAT